ncbi:outer membrane lipoprotein carrier protein LolA [Geobacter sp. FeAm09]|uniref:LolA family protein n=1 Tax=Geobacter sp. FeAm09 TaxID=2597769 RepID=UPI001F112971|nr:outer membrane lipoprotein carrier protein LolA [Geobacter sp. FeAm09]
MMLSGQGPRFIHGPARWRVFAACGALLAFLAGAIPCQARQIPAVEGLEVLRKAFTGVTDFTAEISQEKRLSLMKRAMTMNGTVRFRKPDQFYLELNAPYASRMVLRDNTIEQVMGASGGRNRIVLPPEQGLKRWFTRLATPITTLPEGLGVHADATGPVYTVTIAPRGKGQVRELVITFLDDGTIRKLVIVEQNGDRAVMTFKKVRRNVGLTDRDFRLE